MCSSHDMIPKIQVLKLAQIVEYIPWKGTDPAASKGEESSPENCHWGTWPTPVGFAYQIFDEWCIPLRGYMEYSPLDAFGGAWLRVIWLGRYICAVGHALALTSPSIAVRSLPEKSLFSKEIKYFKSEGRTMKPGSMDWSNLE